MKSDHTLPGFPPDAICRSFCLLIALVFSNALSAQVHDRGFRVAFYNLENLFHPSDDSLKADEEFTPEGIRYWNDYRYREKSARMAKAILSIGEWEPPEIVGVAEIENRKVLEDLVQNDVLRKFGYGILHYESPDRRGIDVGMLYRKNHFTPVYSHNYPVSLPDDPHFATRDILYVKGVARELDTIHLMFCHWPSRYGGQAKSEPKRIQAALTMRSIVDSIFSTEDNPLIAIAGDFNDEYHNQSLKDYLKAKQEMPQSGSKQLINLMAFLDKTTGTNRYRGTWTYIDQVIVSSALLDNKGTELKDHQARVHRTEFLLEQDEKYPGNKPFRSFIGMRYHGGFSDHLPVYIDLVAKEN